MSRVKALNIMSYQRINFSFKSQDFEKKISSEIKIFNSDLKNISFETHNSKRFIQTSFAKD